MPLSVVRRDPIEEAGAQEGQRGIQVHVRDRDLVPDSEAFGSCFEQKFLQIFKTLPKLA